LKESLSFRHATDLEYCSPADADKPGVDRSGWDLSVSFHWLKHDEPDKGSLPSAGQDMNNDYKRY
jgi:hypothetical protein